MTASARHTGPPWWRGAGATHRCYLALALWHLGFPDKALQLNDKMLELARAINQPFSLETHCITQLGSTSIADWG